MKYRIIALAFRKLLILKDIELVRKLANSNTVKSLKRTEPLDLVLKPVC